MAEYRDAAFLRALDLDGLAPALADFWPPKGPQWDALALASDGKVLLVEAKAHLSEMNSACQASAGSLERIARALDETKRYYGANPASNWLTGYYQYANRLAHLRFLRQHGVDAHFVGVYFLGDTEMRGPTEIAGWAKAIDDCYESLGLSNTPVLSAVHHVFVRIHPSGSDTPGV